jgi:hypothetical protein
VPRTAVTRRIGLLVGGIAVAGAATVSGCSATTDKPAETGTSSTAVPSSTEKAVNTGSPNSFSPTVKANPPGTVQPGRRHHGGVG